MVGDVSFEHQLVIHLNRKTENMLSRRAERIAMLMVSVD